MNENELIAVFMGGTKQIIGPEKLHGYNPGTILWRDLFDDPGTVTYLLFDSDWDWLMPVVDRISKIGYDVELYASGLKENHECHIHDTGNSYACIEDSSSLLNATYKAVVAFIIWYNSHYKK